MIRVLIPVLILAVAVVVIAARRGGGLVRGMAGDMLVSPARPAVGVLPASLFHLEQACRLEGSPPSADGPLSAPARADFWYALYDAEAPETSGPASLVALLGVTESPYRWIAGNGAPGAAGEAGTERRLRRESRDIMDGRTVFTVTFLVPSAADPWPRAGAAWQEGSLARRFTFPSFRTRPGWWWNTGSRTVRCSPPRAGAGSPSRTMRQRWRPSRRERQRLSASSLPTCPGRTPRRPTPPPAWNANGSPRTRAKYGAPKETGETAVKKMRENAPAPLCFPRIGR